MTHNRAPNPIDVHVGRRLQCRRVIVGISQSKLGEALGLTFQQIQKYESGVNRMSASRLYMAAQTLDVSPAYFFEDMGTNTTPRAKHPRAIIEITEKLTRITELDSFVVINNLVDALLPSQLKAAE